MIARALAAAVALLTAGAAVAQQIETISFESRQKGKSIEVPATVHWPSGAGPFPALVIHHGSGGISAAREGRYAREIVAMGASAVA